MHWLDEEDLGPASRRAPQSVRELPRRTPVRVLVAHESRLVAEALMFTVETDPLLEPIGYALDGWEAFELVTTLRPDVILVGSRLSGLDGLSLTRFVHMVFPRVRILVLAEKPVPRDAEEAFDLGASDYLPWDRSTNELLDAIGRACLRPAPVEQDTPVHALDLAGMETYVGDD